MVVRTKSSFARRPQDEPQWAAAPILHDALAPTLSLGPSPGPFQEDQGLAPIAPDAQFSDADSPSFGGGSLTVTLNQVFDTDRMALVTNGTGIGLSGSNVTWQNVTIGTLSGGGFGASGLTVTFNASATPAAVQAVIRAIGWETIEQDPFALYLEFTVRVTDDTGASVEAVRTTSLVPVDDRTLIGSLDGDLATAVGGGGAVRLDRNVPVSVIDVDDEHFGGGTLSVRILQNYREGEDLLGIISGNGVSVAAGIISVSGVHVGSIHPASMGPYLFISLGDNATAARLSTLMNAIGYTNSNGFDPSTLTRGIEFMVQASGVTPAGAGVATVHVNVSAPANPQPPVPPPGVPEGPRLLTYTTQVDTDRVLSADGLRLFTSGYDGSPQGYVRIYVAETGGLLQTIRLGVNPIALDVSLDGRYLFVVEGVPGYPEATCDLYRIDLQTGALTTFTYDRAENEVGFNDLACLEDGRVLLAMRGFHSPPDGHGKLLDPATGAFTDIGVIAPGPLERSADGRRVVVDHSAASKGFLYDASLGVQFRETSDLVHSMTVMAHSVNALTLVGSSIYDSNLELLTRLNQYDSQFSTLAGATFDETGAFLFLLDLGGSLIVQHSTTDWSIVRAIPLGIDLSRSFGGDLQVAPDMRYFTFVSQIGLLRVNNPFVPDAVQGTQGADNLAGTNFDDFLIGDTGADTMTGGAGNDIYYVDQLGDVVVEAAGGGSDTIRTAISYVLAAGLEVERLETSSRHGTLPLNLTGNAFAQALVGNAGSNVLDGRAGADTMSGGRGNDFYHVDNAGDAIVERTGEGSDRVFASVSYTLGAGASVELLTTSSNAGSGAINLTGNELANAIIGNAGANVLNGGAGNDTLDGADGNDTLFGSAHDDTLFGRVGADVLHGGPGTNRLVGGIGDDVYHVGSGTDIIVETAGEGDDRVVASVSYTLAAGVSVEAMAVADGTSVTLAGNELPQTIAGNLGADVLQGVGGNDRLSGGGGNDRLIGGAGSDWLEGGGGADLFVLAAPGDSPVSMLRSDGRKYVPDVIADFTPGADRIDLAGLDTIAGTAADDAFTFIGTAAFARQAGQLRSETAGGRTFVYGDVDGDGGADFQLLLAAPATLVAADFIL